MKKILTILLLLLNFSNGFAQISFFKNINKEELSSDPSNFVEVNGIVYFIVKYEESYKLWKTNSTESGTVQVTNQNILVAPSGFSSLFSFNSFLYYYVQNKQNLSVELWKTNGETSVLVMNSYFKVFFQYKNDLFFLDTNYNQIKKIENDSIKIVKSLPSTMVLVNSKPILLNNELVFFLESAYPENNLYQFQLWTSNGNEEGTHQFFSIDSLNASFYNRTNLENNTNKVVFKIGKTIYFFVNKKFDKNHNSYQTQLWKTDGTRDGTSIIKTFEIEESQPFLMAFDEKKFLFGKTNELWISDGTTNGTKKLRNFENLTFNAVSYADKFYFTANDGVHGYELWKSDGTEENTIMFKDIDPNGSSNPTHYQEISGKLYFWTYSEDVLWETDGTSNGTVLVDLVKKKPNDFLYKPELVKTSYDKLIFKNYDSQNGYELWQSDITFQNLKILKNIRTNESGSLPKKLLKIGECWYFTAEDNRGLELWKTDGTPSGTSIVKDINPGSLGIYIEEYVEMNGVLFFTARLESNNLSHDKIRLFRSDGTSQGTYEIDLDSQSPTFEVYPRLLRATSNKLFFVGYRESFGTTLWVSDGTAKGTETVFNATRFSTPSIMVVVNDKLFFMARRLWVTDGSELGTREVFPITSKWASVDNINALIEFKGKLVFLSSYYSTTESRNEFALMETNGEDSGTRAIKIFGSKLVDSYMLFLEKTSDKIYFRSDYSFENKSFDLWTSDATLVGTKKVKTIYSGNSSDLYFQSVGQKLHFQFVINIFFYKPHEWWVTDGTEDGTQQIQLPNPLSNVFLSSGEQFKNNLYLTIFTPENGAEFWRSNGTTEGTERVIENRKNNEYSLRYLNFSNLMSFNDRLLLGADDGNRGHELWQFLPLSCENNINYTLQSGLWNDPSNWSCNRIPNENDRVIIKSPHKIIVPLDFVAKSGTFETELGAIFEAQNGVLIDIKPK